MSEGSPVAKSINEMPAMMVNRPVNHFGNILVFKRPIPHIEVPNMIDE